MDLMAAVWGTWGGGWWQVQNDPAKPRGRDPASTAWFRTAVVEN